ncbi:MAG: DUF167 domain-containing protein [Rickettsiales bacterium]|jgi:uncharacterized protein (TIGR00251 family)|nr:DUF167 domain-containing protein [Rickettsiales bacterium]
MPIVNIRVIPRAKQNCVQDGNPMRAYTTVAPADGKANDAVIKLLSEYFGVAKSRIKIAKGKTSRNKVISIDYPVD